MHAAPFQHLDKTPLSGRFLDEFVKSADKLLGLAEDVPVLMIRCLLLTEWLGTYQNVRRDLYGHYS